MEKQTIDHITANLPAIDLWIEMNAKLEASSDVLQPIVKEFKAVKEHANINLSGCKECLIDMLRWAKSEYKKATLKTK